VVSRGSRRAMGLSCMLPPESPVEKNRNTRQVSHLLWALARRTRLISRRLHAQATQLCRDSQALGERHQRWVHAAVQSMAVPCPVQEVPEAARRGCGRAPDRAPR
jgi:hypothetical protein